MRQCSEKAFAMCPSRHLCGSIEGATFADHSECAAFNKRVEEKPMTNADMIRSMTDKELARWLEYEGGGACAEMCRWLKWLQQPAEKQKEDAK